MSDYHPAAIDAAAEVHHKMHCSQCCLWPDRDCDAGRELDIAAVRMILAAATRAVRPRMVEALGLVDLPWIIHALKYLHKNWSLTVDDEAHIRALIDRMEFAQRGAPDGGRADVPAPGAAMTMREIRAALASHTTPEGDPS